MITWHVGKKVEVVENENPESDVLRRLEVSWYEGTNDGYTEYTITMILGTDGSLCLSNGSTDGGFVYLYPEQAGILKSMLKSIPTPLRGKRADKPKHHRK